MLLIFPSGSKSKLSASSPSKSKPKELAIFIAGILLESGDEIQENYPQKRPAGDHGAYEEYRDGDGHGACGCGIGL